MKITLQKLKKRYPKELHSLFEHGDMGLYGDEGLIAYNINKEYAPQLLKMALDKDFNRLTYHEIEIESEEFEDQDPSLWATYAPLHALIALTDIESYDGLQKIMDDFDNNPMDDENYLFAFDYFCASAYESNSQFINEVLFDNKNSKAKRIRVFYIFKEVIKYFKDDKSLKSIEDTANRFLELGSDNIEFNDLAVKTLLLINGKSYSKKIIEKYLIVGAELEEPKEEKTDIKREFVDPNEPCPCGSKKKFKKCCMKEYIIDREEQNATDLTPKEIEKFKKIYKKILQFSYQYREKKKRIFADNEIFKREAIDYFYENRNEIIMKFREQNTVSAEFSELLEGINRAFYGDSTVIAHTEKYALIAFGSNVSTLLTVITKEDKDFKDYIFGIEDLEQKYSRKLNSQQIQDSIEKLFSKSLKTD